MCIRDRYGLERFRVGIGSSTDYNDFTIISSGNYIEAPTSWTQYEFDLSDYEGSTIRIAINYVGNDSFALQMDSFLVEGTLGINDFENNDIQYFYDSFEKNLKLNSNKILKKIEVFNLLGQNLISSEINSFNASFNLSNLEPSIYLVKVIGESGLKTIKLQVN